MRGTRKAVSVALVDTPWSGQKEAPLPGTRSGSLLNSLILHFRTRTVGLEASGEVSVSAAPSQSHRNGHRALRRAGPLLSSEASVTAKAQSFAKPLVTALLLWLHFLKRLFNFGLSLLWYAESIWWLAVHQKQHTYPPKHASEVVCVGRGFQHRLTRTKLVGPKAQSTLSTLKVA